MCFSVQASFTTAAVLAVLGSYTLSKARTPGMRLFAINPLFFALQQALEGIVWVTLNAGDTVSLLHSIGVYGFLFFAGMFWPVYIPGSLYVLEENPTRKKILATMLIPGCLLAGASLISFISFPVTAHAIHHHIRYDIASAAFYTSLAQIIGWGMYVLVTSGAMFISSIPYMWLVGCVVTCGFVVAHIFYYMIFGSVWCFFAAITSILTYVIVDYSNRNAAS